MPASKAQYRATAKYIKNHYRLWTIQVKRNGEEDMIAWLESKDAVSPYIKSLIRADMVAHKADFASADGFEDE